MSLLNRVVESGPPSALDQFASMAPSTSMKFEGLGKQLCTSGWFLGSFCVRSPAALIALALMMLVAAIWVRCGLALAGLGPPLDDAMLFGCSWGRFSTCVRVVQLLPGISSCVCESDGCLHFCFPGSSEAFDTEKGLVGFFCSSCVWGIFLLASCGILAAVKRLSSPVCLPCSTAAAALDDPHALIWDAVFAPGL